MPESGAPPGNTGSWYMRLMKNDRFFNIISIIYFIVTFEFSYLSKFLKDKKFRKKYSLAKRTLFIEHAHVSFEKVMLGNIRIPYSSVSDAKVETFSSIIADDGPLTPIVVMKGSKANMFIAVSGVHKLIAYKKAYGNGMTLMCKVLRKKKI